MVEHIAILNWCMQVVLLQMHVDCILLSILKGQYHGRYHDFWPKFTKFKL